jgi:hypothetical protein
MATETHIHDGSAHRKLKQWHVHDGSSWRDLKKVYCHDGSQWRLVFQKDNVVAVHVKLELSTAISGPSTSCSSGWSYGPQGPTNPNLGGWGIQFGRVLTPSEIGEALDVSISLRNLNQQNIQSGLPYFGIGIAFEKADGSFEVKVPGGYAQYAEVWTGYVYTSLTSMTDLGSFNIQKTGEGAYEVVYTSLL